MSALPRLDEIRLKAKLIETSRALNFDDFSGDGEFLVHYPLHEFVGNLGRRHDDSTNTFTARLLLLLESKCLLNDSVYEQVLTEVIEAYWHDFDDHKDEFVPGFLVNDILRLWRTFCVNYEANTSSDPVEERAKRQIKHYKLQHSRLLTCFSGIVHLLSVFSERGTVTQADALELVGMPPLKRIERVGEVHGNLSNEVAAVLNAYDEFLQRTSRKQSELVDAILQTSRKDVIPPLHLNEAIFDLIQKLGSGNKLHRHVVV